MKPLPFLLLGCLLMQPGAAQDTPPGIPPVKQDDGGKEKFSPPSTADPKLLASQGFAALFDGQTLDGWRKAGGTGQFKVEGGGIVGFGQNIRGNTFLCTEKTYSDFIFVFEMKFIDQSGNSGCQFRSQQKENDGRVFGYQCEHDNNGERSFTAGVFDEARRGWLFPGKLSPADTKDKFTAQGKRLFKPDDWNTIVIDCRGNHIRTWLNGEKRADFLDTDKENFTAKGFFALQVHGGKSGHILWRNIYLKELALVK
jgi:hypothetical protein